MMRIAEESIQPKLRQNGVSSGGGYSQSQEAAMLRLSIVIPQAEVNMLVTLVAILCNGQLCLEKVVTDSEQSGITMTACQANGQIGIADWLANGPYHEWKLEGYRCVLGKFTPRHDA